MKHRGLVVVVAALLVGRAASGAIDQTGSAVPTALVYGHHHFNATDPAAHLRFWIEGLGGESASLEGFAAPIVRFPGTLLFFRTQAPKGAMTDTGVRRIRFSVRSLADVTRRLRTAGFESTSSAPHTAVVRGPDDVVVELMESSSEQEAVAYRELVIDTEDPEAMRAWYVRHLPGITVMQGDQRAERAAMTGTILSFERSHSRRAGTQGSALDHIGFEVENLEAYCAELSRRGVVLDRPYTKVANTALAIAFFTDPWGTHVELTEGLDTVR